MVLGIKSQKIQDFFEQDVDLRLYCTYMFKKQLLKAKLLLYL